MTIVHSLEHLSLSTLYHFLVLHTKGTVDHACCNKKINVLVIIILSPKIIIIHIKGLLP